MKVSVIIPHYNSPFLLMELLKSIGEHKEIEVIVIDDHSNINCECYNACVMEYSGRKGFFFLENDADKKGAGSARNVGLKYATGKWLLFADADDLFLDTMYERVTPFLDSDFDIVYFPPYYDNDQEDREGVRYYRSLCRAFIDNVDGADTLLRYQFVVPWSKMIRRELVEENHITFDEVPYSNDVMFSVKCGKNAKRITASSNPIYFSRSTEGSLIKQKTEDSFFTRAEVNCEYFAFIRNHATEEQKKHLFSIAVLRTYYRIIKNGYGLSGLRRYRKMLRKNSLHTLHIKGAAKTYRIKQKLKSYYAP